MSIYDFTVTRADGSEVSLADYEGKTVLIVNTASQCGFTPQYEGLETLYQRYQSRDFVILGFPCNQFGKQEPGSAEEISQFCSLNFGVSFPLMAKIEVNGSNAAPLYQYLKAQAPGILGTQRIKWNFTKFLINPQGDVVKRYAPQQKPEALAADIEALLPK